jgi:hypothetical protein
MTQKPNKNLKARKDINSYNAKTYDKLQRQEKTWRREKPNQVCTSLNCPTKPTTTNLQCECKALEPNPPSTHISKRF